MQGMLIGRRLLALRGEARVIEAGSLGNLSAIAWTATSAGPRLWLGGDEAIRFGTSDAAAEGSAKRNAIAVLDADGAGGFVLAEVVPLAALLPGFPFAKDKDGDEGEVDIEGMAIADGWLWLTGSHSAKRRRPKGADAGRLARIEIDANRFLIARIPLAADRLLAVDRDAAGEPRRAAALPLADAGAPGNALIQALADDAHLGPFLTPAAPDGSPVILPGKDNGFDIEGIAVRDGRVYLGLRGPVLRGYAVILMIRPEDDGAGGLRLAPVDGGGGGALVRKLFLDLKGMGVRDLDVDGDDLLILAGPTMELDGTQALWRLRAPHTLGPDSVTAELAADLADTGADGGDPAVGNGRLRRLFDLPLSEGDRAEGLCRFPQPAEHAVLVVYDRSAAARHPPDEQGRPIRHLVYADLFRLPAADG